MASSNRIVQHLSPNCQFQNSSVDRKGRNHEVVHESEFGIAAKNSENSQTKIYYMLTSCTNCYNSHIKTKNKETRQKFDGLIIKNGKSKKQL